MRNRTLIVFLAVVLALSLVFAACAKPEPISEPIPPPTPAPKPTPAPAPSPKPSPAPAPKPFEWPERLSLGTSSVGSGAYMIAGAWTTELEKSTGMTVRVVPEGGTVLRFRWLRNGIIDMYTDSMGTTRHLTCYRAEQRVPDGGPFRPRMVFSAAIQAWGLAVRKDSPLKTVYDIGPDTKVAFFPPPSDMTFGMLYWMGLNDGPVLEDPKQGKWKVKIVPFSSPGGFFRSVLDGKADVVFMTATNPSAIEQAASPMGIRFLEIPYETEPEGVQKFLDVYAVAGFGPAPEEGVKEIWGVNTLLTYGSFY